MNRHKKLFNEILSLILIFSVIAGTFYYSPQSVQAATYYMAQDSWSGGASASTLAHPFSTSTNIYYTTSTNITAGANLQISGTSYYFTDDGAASTTHPSATGGGFSNGTNSSTTVSGSGSGASVALTQTGTANTWSVMTSTTLPVYYGGALAYDGSGNIYGYIGNYGTDFLKYSISSNTWSAVSSTPSDAFSGSLVYDGSGNMYMIEADSNTAFWKYSISSNTWSTMSPIPIAIFGGGFAAYDGSGNIYALRGGGTTSFWKYSISGNSWSVMASTTADINTGGALAYDGAGNIYAVRGGNTSGFLKYSISGNSWSTVSSTPIGVDNGGDLVYGGSGNIYHFSGFNSSTSFWRYATSTDTWTGMASTTIGVLDGASFAYDGGNYIYAFRGNNTTSFWRYSINNSYQNSGVFESASIDLGGVVGPKSVSFNQTISGGAEGKSWGYNGYGQLGDGTNTDRNTPVSVSGITNAVAIAGGGYHSLALLSDGTMKSWGQSSYGQLGDGTNTSRTTPVSVSGITNAVAIAGGEGHSLALLSDGTMKSWGYNIDGQLGDGTNTDRNTPVSVSGITNAVAIAGGGYHSLALLSDGTMKSWGYNANGRLGDGTTTNRNTPVSVSGITNAVAIAGGGNYSLAISGGLYFQISGNADNATWNYKPLPRQIGVAANRLVIPPNLSGSSALRYIKYKAYLNTATSTFTPSLDSLTINYVQFPTSGTLTSSKYDSGSANNLVSKINWTESATSTTETVRFQIRTASSSAGLDSAVWCGYEDCSGTSYFGDNSNEKNTSVTSTHPIRSDNDDRWFQYKVFLASDGTATPAADDVVITYVVNAAPEFDASYGTNGVSVSQNTGATDYDSDGNSDLGKVLLIYSARDSDTLSGTVNPGYVASTLEYRLNSQGAWTAITSGYLNTGALSNKPVSEINYTSTSTAVSSTSTSAIWNAASQLGTNTYSTTTQIRVTISDNEGANSTAQATSASFTLDTKIPTASITIDSSGSGDSIAFNFSDDSNIEYRASNSSNFSDDGNAKYDWQTVGATSTTASTTWTLIGSPSYETVYFRVRDVYGNIIATSSDTAPNTPQNLYYKDISDPLSGDYREFLSWGVYSATTSASFGSYQVYRSTDGANYSQIVSITDSAQNYYNDNSVSSSTTYYYKVRFVDSDGDISNFTSSVSDTPNGQGGTDVTAPTISNASSTEVQSAWARITWTTDEIATSSVEYSTQAVNNYASSTTVNSFLTSHTVTITGLTPNTAYVYRVKSTDISGNTATASGYSFTTVGGPVITGVSCQNATDNSSVITWNTDKATASSLVEYSTNSNLVSYSTASVSGVSASTTANLYYHQTSLSSLSQNTVYYFRVKSTDLSGNQTIENNSGNYYTCRTTQDTKPPTISNIQTPVITSNAVVVVWQTDESANSQIEYGSTSGSYTTSTSIDSTMTTVHTATISGLNVSTAYYYRVKSTDANGNQAISSEQTANTTTAKDIVIVYITSGGGGGEAEKKDTTAPSISGIEATDIGAFNATVKFITSEDAIAIVEYGETNDYGLNSASKDYSASHVVKLSGLKMGTDYHFKIKALDKFGNAAYSPDGIFITKYFSEMVKELKELANIENLYAFQRAIEESIESIAPSIIPPFIEKPRVSNITENSAIIKWKTNISAYSSALYAPENEYDSSKINAYILESSNTENKNTEHEIKLNGLTPNTKYHFMVKSYRLPQAVGKSDDMTFMTLAPKITPRIIDIDNDAITIIWTTDEPASSIVEYKNLRTGEINRKTREEKIISHNVKIENLMPDTSYEIKAMGYNEKGNLIEAGESIVAKTSKDTVPPVISNLKIDGALVPGRNDKVQMVVSWRTDEPATSLVEYGETMEKSEDLANKVAVTDAFVQSHTIIITTFKPGNLYQIRVTSIDDAGNKSVSPIRTIITPRQAESIIDVVVKNFEDTFQFLRKLK